MIRLFSVSMILFVMTISTSSCRDNTHNQTLSGANNWRRITLGTVGIEPGKNFHYVILGTQNPNNSQRNNKHEHRSAVVWSGPEGVSAALHPDYGNKLYINGHLIDIPISDKSIFFLKKDYSTNRYDLTDQEWVEFESIVNGIGWEDISRHVLWKAVVQSRIQQVN